MSDPEMAVHSTEDNSSSSARDGITTEAPLTRPFEGFTYIRKEWVDQEEGIEKVTYNLTMGQVNSPADWSRTEVFVMMPQWGSTPLKRTWIVRLPTHFEGSEKYLFHYFFQVYYNNGTDRVSSTFTQLMVPQQFEFIDHSGEMLFIRLHWSVGNWTYAQDSELEVDGIEWGSESSVSNSPYRSSDRLFQSSRFLLMRRLPVPRRFRGMIWVPKGSEIRYCFQLVKHTPDGLDIQWDNNFGKDYTLVI